MYNHPDVHFRKKQNTGKAHKTMILLLSMGCGFGVLYICTLIVESLVLDKYFLVVSLPGGLKAQAISADSRSFIVSIVEVFSGNIMVIPYSFCTTSWIDTYYLQIADIACRYSHCLESLGSLGRK